MRTIGSILVVLGTTCAAISLGVIALLVVGTAGAGAAAGYGAGLAIGMVILGLPGGLVLWWVGSILQRRPRGGYTAHDAKIGLGRLAGNVLVGVGAFFFIGGLSLGVGRGPDPEGGGALANRVGVFQSAVLLLFSLGIATAGVLLRRRFRPVDPSERAATEPRVKVRRDDGGKHAAEDRLSVHRCPACRILNRVPAVAEGESFDCAYCGEVVTP